MTIKEDSVIIVGGGLAGVTAAVLLAKQKKHVVLYEKREIGGACCDLLDTNTYTQHYGSHIFHTSNKEVYDFIQEFTILSPYQHKVKALVNGDLIPVPFNLNSLDKVNDLSDDRKELIKNYLDLYLLGKEFTLQELLDSEHSTLRKFGEYIKERIFEGYSKKQWGEMPEPDVLNRVKAFRNSRDDRYFLDKYQGIPIKGFLNMMENMLSKYSEYIEVTKKDFNVRNLGYYKHYNHKIIFTGAIDELLEYKYGELPYRTCNFIQSECLSVHLQDSAVINYPNDYAFTRTHDYSYYLPGTVSYQFQEYPKEWSKCSSNLRFYPVRNNKSLELYNKYVQDLKQNYSNVHLAGRLGKFKYMNMDKVIEDVFNLINVEFNN